MMQKIKTMTPFCFLVVSCLLVVVFVLFWQCFGCYCGMTMTGDSKGCCFCCWTAAAVAVLAVAVLTVVMVVVVAVWTVLCWS